MPKLSRKVQIALIPFVALMLIGSCVTPVTEEEGLGMSQAYKGFIPAKVVVLTCADLGFLYEPAGWNKGGDAELRTKLCTRFDQAVLDAFRNQPFMNGYSPNSLKRRAEELQKPDFFQWHPNWPKSLAATEDKNLGLVRLYRKFLSEQSTFRQWLGSVSRETSYSDAVLMPAIEGVLERSANDRGLLVGERRLSVVLLMIDTASGSLIWSGRSEAKVAENTLADDAEGETQARFPDWQSAMDKLFVETLWLGYPGRVQNN